MDLVTEKRGSKTPPNKIDRTDVIEHLKSFRTQPDLVNPDSNRITLPATLNIKKLYQMYVAKCDVENKIPVKEKFFYNVAKTNFNIKFQKLKKPPQTQPKVVSESSPNVLIYTVELCPP